MGPGWYPDPFSDGLLRWWDGSTWTARTMPNAPQGWAFLPNPGADLAGERAAGTRASIALVVGVAATALSYVGYLVAFRHFQRELRPVYESGPALPDFGGAGGRLVVLPLAGLLALAVEVVVIIWLYKAAIVARRAGLPARRQPGWAIAGFVVPIVNFWFPYQVAADCFPPGHPARRTAARWWAWTLTQTFLSAPVGLVAIFSAVSAAVAFAAAAVLASVMAAREGRVMIASIDAVHHELVRTS